jgi:hypothetical protein
MVTVASAFLRMLNWKWSFEKFQDEQFNEKIRIASSDGDICILWYNISVGNISKEERQPCTSLEVESNISDTGRNTGVIVGVYKPCSKCFKRSLF